jgi:putative alpha-1,2-mannosidase
MKLKRLASKPWLNFSDVFHGGTLVYDLGSTANTNWGSHPAGAPLSYADGKSWSVASKPTL